MMWNDEEHDALDDNILWNLEQEIAYQKQVEVEELANCKKILGHK